MNTKRNTLFVFVLFVFVMLALSACGSSQNEPEGTPYVDNQSEQEFNWFDEDGYAIVGDTSTPRFVTWIVDFIKVEYGLGTRNMGGWYQVYVSSLDLTISWGEHDNLRLGNLDGNRENKTLFIAQRDIMPWVHDSSVEHITCIGTFVSQYKSSSMANWEVSPSTVIQFDGSESSARSFIKRLAQEWYKVRNDLGGCTR